MSLRNEIHTAFEAITPPTGGMAERVVEMARREARTQKRSNRLMVRMRPPLSLVAVFVVIALAAAVLVGSQVLRAWNVEHTATPAGSVDPELARLEARPLQLPYVHSVKECTTRPVDPQTGAMGAGPLFMDPGYAGAGWTGWGDYGKLVLYSDTNIAGPILVRARDVVTKAQIVFVGRYATGAVLGTDTLEGRAVTQYSELVLSDDTTAAPTDIAVQQPHRYEWELTAGFPKFSTLSAAWQIDGGGFSETFVVC